MASIVYNNAKAEFARGSFAWHTGGQWRVLLVAPGYTPDPDHVYVSDVVAYEVSGTGYTGGYQGAGRKALTGRTITVNTATDNVTLDGADVSWSVLSFAGGVGGAVLFWEQSSDADSPVVAFYDLANTGDLTGEDVIIVWSVASGMITLT